MDVDPTEPGRQRRGVIDGSARVIGEVLRTPRIVKTARILLGNIDPEAAPALVRAVMFSDSVLFLDALAAAPALANAAVLGAREVCDQLLGLPTDLLHRFVARLISEVSGEEVGVTTGLALVAAGRLVEAPGDSLAEVVRAFEADFIRGLQKGLADDDAVVGRQVERLAATIRRVARENPQLMARVVRPLAAAWRDALEE